MTCGPASGETGLIFETSHIPTRTESENMIRFLAVSTLASLATLGVAEAKIPLVNATCPTGIEVHADEGGPVYINGKEAALKVFNQNSYEATHGNVMIDLTITPDGSVLVSYTKKGGANGICTVADDTIHESGNKGHGHKSQGCPPDVSEADRYKYPACN